MCYTEPLKCCRFWRHLTMTLTLKAKINCSSQISVCFGHSFIYIIFYTSIANNWRREALGFQVFSPSVNAYCTWRDITVLSEEISMKLCKLYIYHLSELLKRFPRSEVKDQGHSEPKCTFCGAEAYISTAWAVWRRGAPDVFISGKLTYKRFMYSSTIDAS